MHQIAAAPFPAPRKKKPLYQELYMQVLIGVLIGVLLGHFAPDLAVKAKPLGDAFIKIIKMMIVPVVFSTIVIGLATVGADKNIGMTLLKSLALFIALMIGLIAVEGFRPGAGMHLDPKTIDPSQVATFAGGAKKLDTIGVLLHIIPTSYFTPFGEGEVLPTLFIALITGLGLRKVGKMGAPFLAGLQSFSEVIFAAFGMLMKFAPIGAFGAIAFVVATNGLRTIGGLGLLILTFYAACLFFVFVVLGALAWFHGFSLWKLLRYIRDELLVVLGTSSTEPVLPAMLYKLEKLGCAKGSVGLTLPLGYSFNLDGTAIYLTLSAVFLSQAMDIPLTQGQILVMLMIMLLTSKGAAGVSGSGFAALVATLAAMPDMIPVAGVVMLGGIDRFLVLGPAVTSLCSNAVGCVVLAIWENACDRETLARELDAGYAPVDSPRRTWPASPADSGQDSCSNGVPHSKRN